MGGGGPGAAEEEQGKGGGREPPPPQPEQGAWTKTGPLHPSGEAEDGRRADFPPLPSSSELAADLPKQRCGLLILETQGMGGCRSLHPPLYLVSRIADPQEGMEVAEMCWRPVRRGVGSWGPHRLEAWAGARLWLSGNRALRGNGHSGQGSGVGQVGL